MHVIVRLVCLVALLAGCPSGRGAVAVGEGDPVVFANEAQPVIGRNCAFLGCHGREGVPLTFYAVNFLRLRDPQGEIDFTRPPLDERVLSEAELSHNRRALAGRVTTEDPYGELVVYRLLAEERGGIPHAGVVVFDSIEHPDMAALRRFLGSVHGR